MSGLEAVEIPRSKVSEISTFRIDSEYFMKQYLIHDKLIIEKPDFFTKLSNMGLTVDASAFYPSLEPYYNCGEIPFVRVADVKNEIDYDNCVKVPKMSDDFATLKLCKPGDIVLTKGGTIAKAGLIKQNSYVTRDLIFINSSEMRKEDYISLFLLFRSKFMYDLMVKSSSQSVQPHLTITLIRDLPILIFSEKFKKYLTSIYGEFDRSSAESIRLYKSAENIILTELGLTNFVPSNEPVAVKNFSQSFGASGRLDAEYYQPKYEDYEASIDAIRKLAELCNIYDSTFVPHKNDYKYIELANIGTYGNITGCTVAPFKELPSRARRLVKSGQVIVSSIEGSLASCALVADDYDEAICSTGFYIVDSTKINSETLLVLFKSEPIQQLMKKRCSGTILTAISKVALETMPFPLIDKDKQREIADMVQKSFALRRQSEQLLDMAKRAVEVAIEDGEEKAIEFLEDANERND